MTTLELAKECPEAWKALPEAYREDDVLEFWWNKQTNNYVCRPKLSEVEIVGNWSAYYSQERDQWFNHNGSPIN